MEILEVYDEASEYRFDPEWLGQLHGQQCPELRDLEPGEVHHFRMEPINEHCAAFYRLEDAPGGLLEFSRHPNTQPSPWHYEARVSETCTGRWWFEIDWFDRIGEPLEKGERPPYVIRRHFQVSGSECRPLRGECVDWFVARVTRVE